MHEETPAASDPVTLAVNGQETTTTAATVEALLAAYALRDAGGVAVAVNDAVIPRSLWPRHPLRGGDRVTLIQAAQGG